MANRDPRAELGQAPRLAQVRGLFGWLTRLFRGKRAAAGASAGADPADDLAARAAMQRRVLATGTQAQAVVRGIQDTGAQIDLDPVLDLVLEVHLPGRPAFQVQTRTPVAKLAVPRMNETVQIKVNPRNPQELAIVR